MTGVAVQGRRPGRRARTLLVAGIVLAGCGEAVGPGDLAGDYALRRMNDRPLPYDHDGLGCCTYLRGGLVLDAASYQLSLTARNRNTTMVFTAREWGRIDWRPPSLTFTRDSFEIAPLLPDVARVDGDSVRVAVGGEGPGSPDQFQLLFVRTR